MKMIRIYSYLLLLFSATLISCREDDIEEGLDSKKLSAKNSKIVSPNVVPISSGTNINKIDSLYSIDFQVNNEYVNDQDPKGIPPKK